MAVPELLVTFPLMVAGNVDAATAVDSNDDMIVSELISKVVSRTSFIN